MDSKILTLMIYAILKKISKVSVHVIGDTIVDSYTKTIPIGGPVKYPP